MEYLYWLFQLKISLKTNMIKNSLGSRDGPSFDPLFSGTDLSLKRKNA